MYCYYAWNWPIVYIERGEIKYCCLTQPVKITQGDIETLGMQIFTNHPSFLARRKSILRNRFPVECNVCKVLEKGGVSSLRTTKVNAQYVKSCDMTAEISAPQMLEFSMNNSCDLGCIYCGPHNSSRLAKEHIEKGLLNKRKYREETKVAPEGFGELFWKWLSDVGCQSIAQIGIVGGEPTLYPKLISLLTDICKMYSNVGRRPFIWIITNLNCSELNRDRFICSLIELSAYADFEIRVSVESTGERAEHIRRGLDWKRFDDNFEKLLSFTEYSVGLIPTVNLLSIAGMPEFFAWLINKEIRFKRNVSIYKNIINYPVYLAPFNAPYELSKYIYETIDIIEKRRIKYSECLIENDMDSYKLFLNELANKISKNNKSIKDIDENYFFSLPPDVKNNFNKVFYEFKIKS